MDWCSTILGAIIGFIASIGTMVVQQWMDRAGKLKLYCVTVRGDHPWDSIGFSTTDSGELAFVLPIRLEILNTSNITRVIRDVSVWTYSCGKPIQEMIQIENTVQRQKTKTGLSEESNGYGGDKNMYSFVIPPRSIQREHCSYMLTISDSDKSQRCFDEVRLSYFDEHDKKHVFHLRDIENAWTLGRLNGDDNWVLLKE